MPTLQQVYGIVLSLPAPAATFPAEMRRLLDIDVATDLLTCLVSWAELHLDRNIALEGWDEGRTDGAGTDDLPSLESVRAMPHA